MTITRTERPASAEKPASSLDQLVDAFVARDEAKADAITLATIDRHLSRPLSRTAQDFLLDHRNVITRRIAARAALAESREG
jgi:hypothetical protein